MERTKNISDFGRLAEIAKTLTIFISLRDKQLTIYRDGEINKTIALDSCYYQEEFDTWEGGYLLGFGEVDYNIFTDEKGDVKASIYPVNDGYTDTGETTEIYSVSMFK